MAAGSVTDWILAAGSLMGGVGAAGVGVNAANATVSIFQATRRVCSDLPNDQDREMADDFHASVGDERAQPSTHQSGSALS
jgi:hypothetical protein